MARKLQVEIIGDASSLQRALGNATNTGSKFGNSLKTLGKTAAIAGGAAGLGALFVTMKQGFAEVAESQRVMAQTSAVLKSTGQAANVTSKEITNYAESLSKMSGVDDEAIQSGENMLLTFTNVRNEVGKGNDIFKQATGTLLDMSTALGTDMNKSAIQLGKALNDPVKGVSALARVGVTFTAQQKDQIKAMVASGNVMGAQKLILKELNKEFGGSAAAAGKTLPAQLDKLRNAFDEAAGAVVQKLVPYLTRFLDFVNTNMPTIQAVMDTVFTAIGTAFDKLAAAVGPVISTFQRFVEFLRGGSAQADIIVAALAGITAGFIAMGVVKGILMGITAATEAWAAAQAILNAVMAANPFVLLAIALVALGAALVVAYKQSETFRNIVNGAFGAVKGFVMGVVQTITELWDRFGADIIRTARTVWNAIGPVILLPLRNVISAIKIIVAAFQGDWDTVWNEIKAIPVRILNAAIGLVRGLAPLFLAAAKAIGGAIKDGVVAGIGAVAGWMGTKLNEIKGAISDAAASAYGWALSVGQRIISGVVDGLSGLAGAVKAKAESMIRSGLDKLNPFSSVEHGGQIHIGEPIVRGAIKGLEAMESAFTKKTTDVVRNAVTKAADAVRAGQSQFKDAWAGYSSAALAVFDDIAGQAKTKSEIALENMRKVREQKDIKGAVATAQTGLAEAQAGGDPEAILAAQKTLDDALYRQKEYALEQRAILERTKLDQQTETARVRFQNWLETRSAQQQQEILKEGKGQEAILAKIRSYNQAFKTHGYKLGASLAEGLRDSAGGVTDAANELAAAIAKALGVAAEVGKKASVTTGDKLTEVGKRARGGPVQAGTPYLVGERGPEIFWPGMSGDIVPNAAPSSPASLAGGGGGITVNVYGSVTAERDLAETIRVELMRTGRYNAGGVLGGLA